MKPYVNNDIRNALIAWLALDACIALIIYFSWRFGHG